MNTLLQRPFQTPEAGFRLSVLQVDQGYHNMERDVAYQRPEAHKCSGISCSSTA